MLDELHFRDVMGRFTTGVTVVASRRRGGEPCGLTANAVASVSLRPRLILVCLDHAAASHDCVIEGGSFAVNVLGVGDRLLADRFAAGDRDERFEGVSWREEATGSPILARALAWLDCEIRDVHGAGDHSIVVGEVLACGAVEGEPLLFYRGRYRRIAR